MERPDQYETWKTAQVAAWVRRFDLIILRISESRSTSSRQNRLSSGELILFSGHEQEAAYSHGVAVIREPLSGGKCLDHG